MEAPASNAVYVSQPAVVAQLIKQAANATSPRPGATSSDPAGTSRNVIS